MKSTKDKIITSKNDRSLLLDPAHVYSNCGASWSGQSFLRAIWKHFLVCIVSQQFFKISIYVITTLYIQLTHIIHPTYTHPL